jgi:hypothetical protein
MTSTYVLTVLSSTKPQTASLGMDRQIPRRAKSTYISSGEYTDPMTKKEAITSLFSRRQMVEKDPKSLVPSEERLLEIDLGKYYEATDGLKQVSFLWQDYIGFLRGLIQDYGRCGDPLLQFTSSIMVKARQCRNSSAVVGCLGDLSVAHFPSSLLGLSTLSSRHIGFSHPRPNTLPAQHFSQGLISDLSTTRPPCS